MTAAIWTAKWQEGIRSKSTMRDDDLDLISSAFTASVKAHSDINVRNDPLLIL